MVGKTGNQKIIEQLVADGFKYMFGNPGTVEQGFLDSIADYPDIQYILSHQESIAVMMADGYARATKQTAIVQLHSSPGIGNAVGALYQAMRGHSPLACIAGDAGVKYINMDAQMAADLVAMMEPVTKYATVVYDKNSVLRTLRRAIKIASTPPKGPVYVCLPLDILSEINDEEIFPTNIPNTQVIPSNEVLHQFSDLILKSKRPMLFIGDGVYYSNAEDELGNFAELIGAEIYGCDVGDLNISTKHSCYMGTTGHMFGYASLPITQKGDLNIVIGTYMLPEVFPELGDIYSKDAKVIHIDLNSYEIAKNHRVDISVAADPKMTLKALYDIVSSKLTSEQKEKASKRIESMRMTKADQYKIELEHDTINSNKNPMFMSDFMKELAARLPDSAIVFDEALTNSPAVSRYFQPHNPMSYFVTRGGSLGVGFPGAIGAKVANPNKTVIGFSGDGGSMYTIQALAAAKRHNIGAKFIVCNNASYRLLQLNIQAYWKEQSIEDRPYPVSFDLAEPSIRFDLVAKGFGIDSIRVETQEEIIPAITKMLSDDKPFLIDLVLERDPHSHLIGVKCGL